MQSERRLSMLQQAMFVAALLILLITFLFVFSRFNEDRQKQETVFGDASPPDSRPVLIQAGLDVIPEIQKAGAPWNDASVGDSEHYTGGSIRLYRRNVFYPLGTITVDRGDRGGIHYVAVRAGVREHCGDPSAVSKAFARLVASLGLTGITSNQVEQMQRAWSAESGSAELFLPGVQIRALGGCIPTVTVKAT